MDKVTKRRLLLGAALLGLVLLFYLPVMHAGYIWDDDDYVTNNPALRSLGGLFKIWFSPSASPQYYPIVFTSFWLEYQLWGLTPIGYHLVNVLLHAAAAVSVWLLLDLLAVPGAWFAAAVFALHPINLESVVWITERKNVLSGMLGLLSAIAFLRFRGIGGEGAADRGRMTKLNKLYLVSFGLFVLALLSKSIVAMLPVALIIMIWWKQGEITRADILSVTPFLCVGAASGLFTAWLEVHHVGAKGGEFALSVVDRLIVAGRTSLFYAGKLLWPTELMFNYPRWEIGSEWWQYLFPAGVAGIAVILWLLRGRIGRGPSAAVCCYLVMLFPASGLLNVYPMRFSFVADHFQYLAGIGLIAFYVGGSCTVLRHCLHTMPEQWRCRTIWVIGISIILGLGLSTMRRIPEFRSEETLWTATLAKNPGSWLSANNLGVLRQREGKQQEAMKLFRTSEALKPDDSVAQNGIGLVLMASGDNEQAIKYFSTAISLEPSAKYYNNLGLAYSKLGQRQMAINEFEKAMQASRRIAEPYYNMGFEMHEMGKHEDAAKYYRMALDINPEYADAYYSLGQLLGLEGKYDEAIWHFKEALKFRPDFREARESLDAALALRKA